MDNMLQHQQPEKYWLTSEQWTDIMYSVIGISPYESKDPEDMREYPIPDGVEILKLVRDTQKCASHSSHQGDLVCLCDTCKMTVIQCRGKQPERNKVLEELQNNYPIQYQQIISFAEYLIAELRSTGSRKP